MFFFPGFFLLGFFFFAPEQSNRDGGVPICSYEYRMSRTHMRSDSRTLSHGFIILFYYEAVPAMTIISSYYYNYYSVCAAIPLSKVLNGKGRFFPRPRENRSPNVIYRYCSSNNDFINCSIY